MIGENCVMRNYFLTKYSCPQIKKKKGMGGACGTYGGEDRCIQGCCW